MKRELTGFHVLLMLGGFFGVMLVANGVFLWAALSTFGGLDEADAYRKGLAYNERIADAEAQAALGWRSEITFDEAGALVFTIADAKGVALRRLDVRADLGRPATAQADRALKLIEAEPGRYLAVANPGRGWWIARVEARDAQGRLFRARARLKSPLAPQAQ